ncbi:transposase (25) [Sulfobacillus acidophilus TPY]|nr:transposase (25) [Sulfobacillus acidophilus TPY]
MSTIDQIKWLQAQGYGVSAIADFLGCDRKTVRKYLQQTNFSPTVPVKRPRTSKLDPYKATIDTWLAEDTHHWYKQRHTAQRIFDRLREAFPGLPGIVSNGPALCPRAAPDGADDRNVGIGVASWGGPGRFRPGRGHRARPTRANARPLSHVSL